MRYEDDFKALLGLTIDVCESVKGKTAPSELSWLTDTQPFAGKLLQHLGSILYLSYGTRIENVGAHTIAYTDHSSVIILIRACLETFLTFHHIFIAAPSYEEKAFRHAVWELSGFLAKQRAPVCTDEGKRKVQSELPLIEDLRSKIQASPIFKARNKEFQKQANAGKWKLGKQWVDLAVEASFHKKYFEGVYCYLCDYAHSGGLSLLQINQTDTAVLQREHVENTHGVCLLIMAHFIFSYSNIYQEALITLENKPELKRLAASYHFKDADMKELYG